MPAAGTHRDHDHGDRSATASTTARGGIVSDESLVIRNSDSTDSHELYVQFVGPDGDTVFRQTFRIAPMETVAVTTRLDRTIYRVEASIRHGDTQSAECLIGSDPTETALVEIRNGTVSVSEGIP